MNNLYLDISVIQTLGANCVNRDDTGSPKTVEYGGVTRARVSSQAWKRAMRKKFTDLFVDNDMGKRTKKIVKLVADEISALAPELSEKDVDKMATETLKNIGITPKKEGLSDVLVFFSNKQAKALAELAVNKVEDKKEYLDAFKNNPSYDMTLFGRMVAADAGLNIDAAAQVAHAISTHAVHNEYDYFTAVDDLSEELDETGAGHIGVSEFNASTLYRYASVNINELKKDHPGHEAEIVAGFIEAFIRSMPSGKGNSYANNTLPELIYVTIRKDQPISFVGAFENPVKSNGEGFVKPSIKRLEDYADKVYTDYCGKPAHAFVIGSDFKGAERVTIDELLDEKNINEKNIKKIISDEVRE